MNLSIPQSVFDKIINHAVTEQPHECCGLLGGQFFQNQPLVQSYYPLRNQAAQPETQFFAAPQELFAAMRGMRSQQEALLAIYHSHPRGPAYPSSTDLAMAFYPEALAIIVALSPQQIMRAFKLDGKEIREVKIVTVP